MFENTSYYDCDELINFSIIVKVQPWEREQMKEWTTPSVSETETGMEVTSYMPAELDRA